MPSPIETMIHKIDMECTRCGTPRSVGCKCWEKIMLRCPKCGRKQKSTREPDDPRGTAVVVIQCPKCNAGDFDTPSYEDVAGNEIPWHAGKG